MSDFITAQIRTYVPIIVGVIVGGLASLGVDINDDTQQAMIVALTGIAAAVYYTVASLLAKKWPSFGNALLGRRAQPVYVSTRTNAPFDVEEDLYDMEVQEDDPVVYEEPDGEVGGIQPDEVGGEHRA